MKLLFLTFADLASRAGHLARLNRELGILSQAHEITILCLGGKPDADETLQRYSNVHFRHFQARMDGWNVRNAVEIFDAVDAIVGERGIELVVMYMEVWDLMRVLGSRLGPRRFATILHAMPFLGAPVTTTGDFLKDLAAYLDTGISDSRKTYLRAHANEFPDVLATVSIIANNPTVAASLRRYVPQGIPVFELPKSIIVSVPDVCPERSEADFDFVYMARMEYGKGVDLLLPIFQKLRKKSGQPVRVAVLGRADDAFSRDSLLALQNPTLRQDGIHIQFFGWVDDQQKREIFSRSKVFMYPSWYDNYPTVVNEALAAGLPCVVWDVPFYRACYAEALGIMAVPFKDMEAFADTCLDALAHTQVLGRRAWEFASSFPSKQEVCAQEVELFELIRKGSDRL